MNSITGRVIQYHSSITAADAIGNSIVSLHNLLKSRGYRSYIACRDEETYRAPVDVVAASQLIDTPVSNGFAPSDILLVHFSFIDDVAMKLAQLPIKKGMVYHNITDANSFRAAGMTFLADACDAARFQLRNAASAFDFSIGVSKYNCRELRDCGYRDINTLPVFVNTDEFRDGTIDVEMFSRITK